MRSEWRSGHSVIVRGERTESDPGELLGRVGDRGRMIAGSSRSNGRIVVSNRYFEGQVRGIIQIMKHHRDGMEA